MATTIKKCRVCGKPYEACRTAKRVEGVFRWKDVACSPECGSIYLSQIKASRGDASIETIGGNDTNTNNVIDERLAKFPWSECEEAYEKELSEYFDDSVNE